jgi:dihydrolipoamide dehydrogenase
MMMGAKHLLVLGGGVGGYTAAFLAADLGMEVTLVEADERLGGVCLHRGCIPSKAFLHLARLIVETREAKACGLDFASPRIDLDAMRRWKNQVVTRLADGVATLGKQRRVRWVNGRGVFRDSHTLVVNGNEEVRFDQAIVAVGSSPLIPAGFAKAKGDTRIMDSTGALELQDIPEQLLVIGGGYIGLEMGTVYAALGSRVTVVEMTDGLLPGVDRDLVRLLQARLKNRFAEIRLNTRVDELVPDAGGVRATLFADGVLSQNVFDRVLVAVGRRPNSIGLGLEHTRVELDANGFVRVEAGQRTADPDIFAVGDITGGALLAHKAAHEARLAVETIHQGTPAKPLGTIPAVVFTDPEIAWCGLSETQARIEGKKVSIAKFPWGASGRAVTLGCADGATKLILDPETERVLGVGIVGTGAGELIAEGVLAVDQAMTASQLADCIHAHPTLSETLMESAEVFLGTATHFYRKKPN